MLIIDRYLLRQFIRTFLICFVSLMGLLVVFEVFTNLEEFLRTGEKTGGVLRLMGIFYGYRALAFFDQTSGLLTLLSAMFTVAWIQRHLEMTALMAAGVSRIRVLRPLVAAAVVVSLGAAASRELIIPRFANQMSRKPQDLVGDVGQDMEGRYDNATDVLILGKATYADRQRIAEPNFLLPPTLNSYGKHLVAREAFYQPPQQNRPAGYLLDEVQEPKGLAKRHSLSLNGRPVLITPLDAPDWLKPQQCFVASAMTFEQLTGGQTFRHFASTAQLIATARNPSQGFDADAHVAIHARIVQPLLDITLLLLGLPFVASRETRNIFLAMGLSLAVVTAFMLVVIGSQVLLGSIYLRPALAAWVPLMVFIPAAVASAQRLWD